MIRKIIIYAMIIVLGKVVFAQYTFPPANGEWIQWDTAFGLAKVVDITKYHDDLIFLGIFGDTIGIVIGYNGQDFYSFYVDTGIYHDDDIISAVVYHNRIYFFADNFFRLGYVWDSINGLRELPESGDTLSCSGDPYSIVYNDTIFVCSYDFFAHRDSDYNNTDNLGYVIYYTDADSTWKSAEFYQYSELGRFFIFKGDLYVSRHYYPPWLFRYKGIGNWEIVWDCNNEWCDFENASGYVFVVDTLNNFVYMTMVQNFVLNNSPVDHMFTLARWDGYSIEPLDTLAGAGAEVGCFYKHKLFLGGMGYFHPNFPADTPYYDAHGILMWDPKDRQYYDLKGGVGGNYPLIHAMTVYHDTLFIGGEFTYTGDSANNNMDTLNHGIAKWYMEDDPGCWYIEPRIYFNHSALDTFYIPYDADSISIYLENNNPYVDSWQWDLGDGGSDTVQCLYHTYHDTGVYNVKITVTFDDSCQASYARNLVILKDTTGNSDTTSVIYARISKSFKIYPNPAKDRFTVEANTYNFDDVLLKVYSGVGYNKRVLLLHSGYNRKEINMQDSRSGVYFVSLVRAGKVIATKKVILKR